MPFLWWLGQRNQRQDFALRLEQLAQPRSLLLGDHVGHAALRQPHGDLAGERDRGGCKPSVSAYIKTACVQILSESSPHILVNIITGRAIDTQRYSEYKAFLYLVHSLHSQINL